MVDDLLSAEEIAHIVNKTTALRYNMSEVIGDSLKKSPIFAHFVEGEVNKYFEQFLDCPSCQSVDEELFQRCLSRRNAVVKRLIKKFAEVTAFKMKHIAAKG